MASSVPGPNPSLLHSANALFSACWLVSAWTTASAWSRKGKEGNSTSPLFVSLRRTCCTQGHHPWASHKQSAFKMHAALPAYCPPSIEAKRAFMLCSAATLQVRAINEIEWTIDPRKYRASLVTMYSSLAVNTSNIHSPVLLLYLSQWWNDKGGAT